GGGELLCLAGGGFLLCGGPVSSGSASSSGDVSGGAVWGCSLRNRAEASAALSACSCLGDDGSCLCSLVDGITRGVIVAGALWLWDDGPVKLAWDSLSSCT